MTDIAMQRPMQPNAVVPEHPVDDLVLRLAPGLAAVSMQPLQLQ